jgi:P27 family predicted phage terminase small subunit
MGLRGPAPDPSSKRGQLRAKAAAKKRVPDPPKLAGLSERVSSRPPAGLGASGRALWRRCAEQEQIRQGDYHALHELCRLEDEFVKLRATINEEGESLKRPVQNARGELLGQESYSNPLLVNLHKLRALAVQLCGDLGLSPHGRSRLGLQIVEPYRAPDDKLDELKDRRRRRLAGEGKS